MAAGIYEVAQDHGLDPAVVGGLCVDIWTGQATRGIDPEIRPEPTRDIDVISAATSRPDHASKLRRLLLDEGFTPMIELPPERCRDWMPPGVPALVQVMTASPWPYDSYALLEIEGHPVKLWDRETTFWQYAENAWSQGLHRGDWIRARALAAAHPDMDWDNIRNRAGRYAWIVDAARDQVPIEELSDRQP